jgi:hypothetical protein
MKMENKRNINKMPFLSILLLIINLNKYLSSYLSSGLKQLNNFIYSDRMKIFTIQNLSEKCSLSSGPNCYYTENLNNKKYIEENAKLFESNDFPVDYSNFNKEWIDIYNKAKNSNYYDVYEEIESQILEYKNNNLLKNDSQQVPPVFNLYLSLTFESYDDKTIKGDVYALPSKIIRFYTENIVLEIFGKLRMHYGEDLKLKNPMKYPSKTFGIIESPTLSIRLGGKTFICESFFMRTRKENIYKINIEGYLGKNKAFSVQKEVNFMSANKWNKITLPNQKIDRLTLPGGIDVDNFRLVMETVKQYEITVQFHKNIHKREEELVDDSDIY